MMAKMMADLGAEVIKLELPPGGDHLRASPQSRGGFNAGFISENRGKKSVWGVVLIDEQGNQVEPLEIIKDKRPAFTVRADFPALGDFALAYIARFPRTTPLLGPNVKKLRLRFFGVRGSVEVDWLSQ